MFSIFPRLYSYKWMAIASTFIYSTIAIIVHVLLKKLACVALCFIHERQYTVYEKTAGLVSATLMAPLYKRCTRHISIMDIVPWFTGGYFGAGWLRDFYRIPEYVRDANNDPGFLATLSEKMRTQDKPTLSVRKAGFFDAFWKEHRSEKTRVFPKKLGFSPIFSSLYLMRLKKTEVFFEKLGYFSKNSGLWLLHPQNQRELYKCTKKPGKDTLFHSAVFIKMHKKTSLL